MQQKKRIFLALEYTRYVTYSFISFWFVAQLSANLWASVVAAATFCLGGARQQSRFEIFTKSSFFSFSKTSCVPVYKSLKVRSPVQGQNGPGSSFSHTIKTNMGWNGITTRTYQRDPY